MPAGPPTPGAGGGSPAAGAVESVAPPQVARQVAPDPDTPDPVAPDPVAPHADAPLPDEDPARSLGAALAAARVAAGRSIEDVAATTCIRGALIRGMEAGRFGPCGGDVYARGHLRSIAGALGVPAADFLDRYDAVSGSTPKVPLAVGTLTEPGSFPLGDRRHQSSAWLLAAVAAAAVVALLAGASLLVPPGRGGPASVTAASSSAAPSSRSATPRSASPVSTPPGGGAAAGGGQTLAFAGVNVVVNVHDQASWVHAVDESGKLVFQGLLKPGDSMPVHAAQRLSFVFGYGPAIDLTVNGRQVGAPPFDASQVAHVSFDASGAGQPG